MANDLGSSLQSILQVPGLQELLNTAITQQRQAAPVRTAIQQQAANMLPSSAFSQPNIGAIPPANYTPSQIPAGAGGTDWTKVMRLAGMGIAGGDVLAKMLGGGAGASFNPMHLVNVLKRLFGHGPVLPSHDPFGAPIGAGPRGASSDPFGSGGDAFPSVSPFDGVTDPSGGSGIGPGMQGVANVSLY